MNLAHVPGLAGYLAQRQGAQQQEQGQLQQFGQVLGLQQALAKRAAEERGMAQQEAFRRDLAALPQGATSEQFAAVAARHTNDPAKLLEIQQKAADRQEVAKDRAMQFAQTLELRQQGLDMQREAFNQRTTDAQARAEFDRWYKSQALVLQQQNAALNAELKRMGLDLQKTKVGEQRVQQLGTALERASLPEADAVLRGVEDALKATPELAEYLSGAKSLLPDLAVSKEIATGRQAFQKLFNITLKNRSGAAVTIPELERLKKEFATGAFKTADQLRSGVEQARKIISDHYRSVAAGFGPDALQAYNDNLRSTGGTPILEPQSAGSPSTKPGGPARITNDAEFDVLPSGATFIGPDGKTRKKP